MHGQARRSLEDGDLPGARRQLAEALRGRVANGEELEAAAVRLDLANLTRLTGNPREAARLAAEVAEWYGRRGMTGFRALALARQAQALLADGRRAPARAAAEQAEMYAEAGEDLELRLAVATAVAPVRAATGDAAAGLDLLHWAVQESARIGAVTAGLEARLELGLLQRQTGDPAAAMATLQAVQREAEARGFRWLAKRAAEGPVVRPGLPTG
jgi:ATP/maltotriose-dependent transcriptional regulator MalT